MGDNPTFERAVEQWLDEHVSSKTGRPYSVTSKTVARYNLTGGRLDGLARGPGHSHRSGVDGRRRRRVSRLVPRRHGRRLRHRQKGSDPAAAVRGLLYASVRKPRSDWAGAARHQDLEAHDQKRVKQPPLTQAEAAALLEKASTQRDRLIVAMLLYTGLRPSELIALEESHIRLDRTPPVVEIRGTAYSKHPTKTQSGYRDIPLTIGQSILPQLLTRASDRSFAPAARIISSSFPAVAIWGRGRRSRWPASVSCCRRSEGDGIHCNPYRFRHTFCTWCAMRACRCRICNNCWVTRIVRWSPTAIAAERVSWCSRRRRGSGSSRPRRGCDAGRFDSGVSRSHGQAAAGGTRTYHAWKSMLNRCMNPSNADWARYGGRGITVCRRWHRFENFFAEWRRVLTA